MDMSTRTMVQVAAVAAMVVIVGVFLQTAGCSKSDNSGTTLTAKCLNTMCPMDMMKIDPMTVSDDAIRDFSGVKIGFCSAKCAETFDKLTDADKKAKVDAAMPMKGL